MIEQYEYIIYLNYKMTGAMRKGLSLTGDQYNKLINQQEQLNRSTDNYGRTLRRVFGTYLSVYGIKQFAQLGTEIKQAQIQFQTLASSADIGSKLYESIVQYANITPYLTNQVSNAAVTMLSFGVAEEKIMPGLQMLGDIAAGNSEKFRALALAYSQSQAAGKLMGQDLLQMINAGFNPLQEISRKTGQSLTTLRKLMEDGAISSRMVEEAFRSATSEGGRFHGMMQLMSEEAFASWSNFIGNTKQGIGELSIKIQEGFKPILNDLSEGSKAFFAWSKNVDLNAEKISHWVDIAIKTIKILAIYKTAVFIASKNMWLLSFRTTAAGKAMLQWKTNLAIAKMETTAFNTVTKMALLTWRSFSTALKANVVGLAITGITLLIAKMVEHKKAAREAALAHNAYNNEIERTAYQERQAEISETLKQANIIIGNTEKYMFTEMNKTPTGYAKFFEFAKKSGITELQTMKSMFETEVSEIKRTLMNLDESFKLGNITQAQLEFARFQDLSRIQVYNTYLKSINKQIELFNRTSGGNGIAFNTLNETSNNIISGGSRPTNITINLGKLQDKTEIHTTTIKEGVADMEKAILEGLLRVLNSSQKLAYQ